MPGNTPTEFNVDIEVSSSKAQLKKSSWVQHHNINDVFNNTVFVQSLINNQRRRDHLHRLTVRTTPLPTLLA